MKNYNSMFLQGLVDQGVVDERRLNGLLLDHNRKELLIANELFKASELPKDRVLIGKLYGDSVGKAYVQLDKTFFQSAALARLAQDMAVKLQCIPLYLLNDVLTVATSYPENQTLVQQLEKLCGCPVSPVFALPIEIQNSIEIQYGTQGDLQALSNKIVRDVDGDAKNAETLEKLAETTDIIELVRGLLLFSLKCNASDIHIQPTAKTVLVRYRIDGLLQTLLELNKALLPPVVARLKILAQCDIAERRMPQDGRVSLEMEDISHDFRLSTVPSVFGEKAVVRAIGQSSDRLGTPIEDLNLSAHNLKLLKRLIHCPTGVLFVTGPTGSGKTTTLYSVISELQNPGINIVTVEDPVESRIDGITQIQVNPAIKLDFAKALRAILRQDPEVVLIGEIRDQETARIAAQAALTGHLVMATMHTNDALQAVTRLIDIGVEPFLVAPSVIGVLSQRLVRRICDHCKESYQPSEELLDQLFYNRGEEQVTFYRGRGCESCHHIGYSGRIAIHEVFTLTNKIRNLIAKNASIIEIQEASRREGFRTLRYDGIAKVLQGITSYEEIDRVTTSTNIDM